MGSSVGGVAIWKVIDADEHFVVCMRYSTVRPRGNLMSHSYFHLHREAVNQRKLEETIGDKR